MTTINTASSASSAASASAFECAIKFAPVAGEEGVFYGATDDGVEIVLQLTDELEVLWATEIAEGGETDLATLESLATDGTARIRNILGVGTTRTWNVWATPAVNTSTGEMFTAVWANRASRMSDAARAVLERRKGS